MTAIFEGWNIKHFWYVFRVEISVEILLYTLLRSRYCVDAYFFLNFGHSLSSATGRGCRDEPTIICRRIIHIEYCLINQSMTWSLVAVLVSGE